jgi:predicted Zn-dependent peptidase
MIEVFKHILPNGLKILIHQDFSTPIASVNLLYNVGSKDESPDKTGFAHLFEHLMFGGSVNIPVYDEPLERVGGENNAFTNNDITNYYITLPAENIETAFWLESDRMLSLAFSKKSLDVQRNVVVEEFNQRYLNQPYGDVWLHLRPLAYKSHPYMWATIGKSVEHIKSATLADVKKFFYSHYAPNNAILCIAGPVEPNSIIELATKWFGNIERRDVVERNLPKEPVQTSPRKLEIERDVPFNAIYKAYHMCHRNHPDFPTIDLLSDILSNGKSARLFQKLVKEKQLFSNVNAYITGDIDEGLFIITGQLYPTTSYEQAELAISEEIELLKSESVSAYELEKVQNKFESNFTFEETSVLNKAMNLAFYELLGNAENINLEVQKYRSVTPLDIQNIAKKVLNESNCSTLYYKSKQK